MQNDVLEAPPRPYLPPSLMGALSSLVAAGLLLEFGWQEFLVRQGIVDISQQQRVSVAAIGAILFAMGVVAVGVSHAAVARMDTASQDEATHRRLQYLTAGVTWLGVGLMLGACSGCAGVMARDRAATAIREVPASSLELRIVGDARASSFGYQQRASAYGNGSLLGDVTLRSEEELSAGDCVRIVGRIRSLDADSWGRSAYMDGTVADIQVVTVLEMRSELPIIERLRDRALNVLNPASSDCRALIAGIVCGRTTELSNGASSDSFAQTGTSHLIAVSGSHLALVASLVQAICASMRAPRSVRTATVLVLMGAYVVFTGGAASAVRSFIMVSCSMASSIFGRRHHGLSALAISAMLLVCFDAGVVFDLGFQLSALSVLFIQVFGSYLRYRFEVVGLPRVIAEPLALTLCAQWATLPITVAIFGTCSVIAPIANIVLGPLMSALLVAGLISTCVAVIVPPLGFCIGIADVLARSSIFVADLLASVPHASLYMDSDMPYALVCYCGAALIYLAWMRIRAAHLVPAMAACACILLIYLIRWSYFAPPAITILDVGQADAILVRDGSAAVLVDAGVDDAVGQALVRNKVTHLDAVVITHWDTDHCGGLDTVLDAVSVDTLIVADGASDHMPDFIEALDLPPVATARVGDVVWVGGYACRIVWPVEPVDGADNEDSLVMVATYRDQACSYSVLLTGDSEVDEELVYGADVGSVDVLKLGHHGSAESVDDDVLELFDPELAIASAGEGNRYGHPAEECVEVLAAHDVPMLCTKDWGDISLAPSRDGLVVSVDQQP